MGQVLGDSHLAMNVKLIQAIGEVWWSWFVGQVGSKVKVSSGF